MQAVKPKKSLVEQTYDILLDAICSGEIVPGERLNQEELAVRLNVSRQPVNSAISILRANRLVEDTGRRGVAVTVVDKAFLGSILELQQRLDPFSAELACLRRPNTAEFEAREVLNRAKAAMRSRDTQALLHADFDFHMLIYQWAENPVIESTMRLNWNHIRRFQARLSPAKEAAHRSWREHHAILSAILRKDPNSASQRMARHVRTTSALLLGA